MDNSIFTFIEKCVACKGCEIACAIEHSQSKSLFGAVSEKPSPKSRVHVETAAAFSYPARCQHCQDASCIAACPMGAMTRHPDTNAVYVEASKCVGCWMCVMVCPFGGVSADPDAKKAVKCDYCPDRTALGLDPACVSACPTKAMIFATPEEMASLRRRETAMSTSGSGPANATGVGDAWRTQQRGV